RSGRGHRGPRGDPGRAHHVRGRVRGPPARAEGVHRGRARRAGLVPGSARGRAVPGVLGDPGVAAPVGRGVGGGAPRPPHAHADPAAPGPVREAAGVKGPRGGFAAGVLLFVVGLLVAAQIHLSGGRVMNVPINDYWLSELEQSACYFLAIIGLNLALGYTGLFSFAHVSLFAMGAYGSAIAVTHHGLP